MKTPDTLEVTHVSVIRSSFILLTRLILNSKSLTPEPLSYYFWDTNYPSLLLYIIKLLNITKISTNYSIRWLYSINICLDNFVTYKVLNLFRNMFKAKTIKTCCYVVLHINIVTQSVPIDLFSSKFIIYTTSFILGKLFLE